MAASLSMIPTTPPSELSLTAEPSMPSFVVATSTSSSEKYPPLLVANGYVLWLRPVRALVLDASSYTEYEEAQVSL